MGVRKQTRGARGAFTLVELLVVIAIIAILVSLTAAAVLKFLGKGPETETRTEIGQLETALVAARTQFGLDYVPSYLVLREDNNYNTANVDEAATVALLRKMFGKRIDLRPYNPAATPPALGIDWNGDGTITQNQPLILEGQHCLVFFIGGIPSPPTGASGCLGFSTDVRNPATQGGTRIGPFYDFKAARLLRDSNNNFFTYQDAFNRQPYAYFSSRKAGNDYFIQYPPTTGSTQTYRLRSDRTTQGPGPGDCPTLYDAGLTLGAYTDGTQFIKPRGFQIISAGPDGVFGPGGKWDPTGGWPAGGTTQGGRDDMANFSGAPLGSPQQ